MTSSTAKRGVLPIAKPVRPEKAPSRLSRKAPMERPSGPNPSGFCLCGCGGRAQIAKANHTAKGNIKGQALRYIFGHSSRLVVAPVGGYEIDSTTGCWVWLLAVDWNGYGKLARKKAHRVFYERANGPIPRGLHLDHLCRNRRCVNPDHLEPVSPTENTRRSSATKLSREDVLAIRASNETNAELALRYGVAKSTIYYARTGRAWKDLAA